MTAPEFAGPRFSTGLPRTSTIVLAIGGIAALAAFDWKVAVSLTVPAAIVIVHVLWLERFLTVLLGDQSPQFRRNDHLKILGHLFVLAVLIGLAHFWPGFSPLAAACGVTLAILAVIVEAFRATEE